MFQISGYEIVIVQMRVSLMDAVNFLHLTRRKVFARIEAPASGEQALPLALGWIMVSALVPWAVFTGRREHGD